MHPAAEIDTIRFDWSTLDDLESALGQFELPQRPSGSNVDQHCDHLNSLANHFKVHDIARRNADDLARGHRDLLVMLLEPADSQATLDHGTSLPSTIKFVDHELKAASNGRNWQNTCIFDIRPFRSDEVREIEQRRGGSDLVQARDALAYDTTEQMLSALRPDVVLLCQSSTGTDMHEFARKLSSSVAHCGSLFLYRLKCGNEVVVINSLHPMYAVRYTDEGEGNRLTSRVRHAMIRFTFLQAANIVAGRCITGPGTKKLQDAVWGAHKSPHCLLPTGKLDRSLDDRSQGFSLAPNASPGMRHIWNKMVAEKRQEVSSAFSTFKLSNSGRLTGERQAKSIDDSP